MTNVQSDSSFPPLTHCHHSLALINGGGESVLPVGAGGRAGESPVMGRGKGAKGEWREGRFFFFRNINMSEIK